MYSPKEYPVVRSIAEPNESFAELLGELATKAAVLVREEVSLARQELRESFRELLSPLLVLAIGIGAIACAALSLIAALILALSQYWEPWLAALTVGLGIAIIAITIISIGLKQLKHVRLKPEQTLATLEENKEWLKEIT